MPHTYPTPPVRLAAFEARFPPVPGLGTESRILELQRGIRRSFPFLEPLRVPRSIELGPDGINHQLAVRHRLLNRNRTTAVTIAEDAVVVETSAYSSFEDLMEVVQDALTRAGDIDEIVGLGRLGLRYVNEVRSPLVQKVGDWHRFVQPGLISAMSVLPTPPEVLEGSLVSELGEGRRVVLRYAATIGRAINLDGPLRVDDRGAGPFFLIDIDSVWEAGPDELPEFDIADLQARCDQLHRSAQDVFEAAVTDTAKREVFGADTPIER